MDVPQVTDMKGEQFKTSAVPVLIMWANRYGYEHFAYTKKAETLYFSQEKI